MMAISTWGRARILAFGGGASMGVLVLACSASTDDTQAAAGTDAAAETSARPVAPADSDSSVDAGSSCNDLAFEGDAVIAGSPDTDAGIPPSTGGVLTDGTYVLASLTDYAFDPTAFPPLRVTVRVDGTFLELATESREPVGVKVARAKFRVTTKDNVLTLKELCTDPPKKGSPVPAAYTATATMFSMQFESPSHAMRWTYQRKP